MKRILLVVTAVVTLLLAVPAFAAEAPRPITSVQLWPEGEPGRMLVLVSAELGKDVKLPATVELPLPKDAVIVWSGEITGGDPDKDIQRQVEVFDAEGGQAVRIRLEQSRVAQYEALVGTMTLAGDAVTGDLEWVQSVDAPKTEFSVRMPVGAADVQLRPGAALEPKTNSAGESLYTLPDRALKAGDVVTIDVSYRRGGGVIPVSAPGEGGSGIGQGTLLAALAALAAVIGALAFVLHKRTAGGATEQ